ncbi:hypothetical protein DFJ77DRAFT_44321 [Powellomyces hirtus]|nr:hypothetical protein DFJ77DRAFT_44321 [Powellomyces hirtus]
MNMGMAAEVSKAGLASLVLAKSVLADVQMAIVARIDCVLVAGDMFTQDDRDWDDLIAEIRDKRVGDKSLSFELGSPSHFSEVFHVALGKRKRSEHESSPRNTRARQRPNTNYSITADPPSSAPPAENVDHGRDVSVPAAVNTTCMLDAVTPARSSSGSDESPLIITQTNVTTTKATKTAVDPQSSGEVAVHVMSATMTREVTTANIHPAAYSSGKSHISSYSPSSDKAHFPAKPQSRATEGFVMASTPMELSGSLPAGGDFANFSGLTSGRTYEGAHTEERAGNDIDDDDDDEDPIIEMEFPSIMPPTQMTTPSAPATQLSGPPGSPENMPKPHHESLTQQSTQPVDSLVENHYYSPR